MLLKTILNTVEKHKSFVYSDARWSKRMPGREIEFDVQPRKNSKPICSGCGRKRPGYDCQVARRFEFVPLWAIPVFLVYAMRRVNCPQCGVVVEQVPWASGKNQQTNSYRMFLATWAKRMSWQEVATVFGTSWDSVFRAVRWVVEWGRGPTNESRRLRRTAEELAMVSAEAARESNAETDCQTA